MTSTSSSQPPLPVGSQGQAIAVISNKYRLSRRLGGGSFGDIYLGEYIPTSEKVAVKFEKHGARCPQLRHEYKVYRELQHCAGFGKVHYFGQLDCYNVMVMELLGYSLEDLFNKCGRRFSLRTVLQLADQVLERVEIMHNRHLIHRDIKPANFVVGHGSASAIVHCIDFGLSKRYRHPRTLQHIAYREGRSLTGTPRYASINNHLGIEQSRRDDLESIGYVLIYFLRGILPWQGLKAKTASKKYKMIMEKKQSVSVAELCHGCPVQFAEFLSYCRSLSFDGNPDMFYLRGLFRDLYVQQGFGVHQSPPATMPSMIATGGRPTIGSAAALAASAGPIEWDWDRFVSPAYYSASAGGGVPSAADGANVGVKGRAVVLAKEKAMKDNAVRGRDLMDIAGGDEVRKEIVISASGGEGGIVAMQSSDSTLPVKRQQQQQSPLHQLKVSLRISDDGEAAVARGEGGGGPDNQQGSQGKQSHKRHLSLSQVAGDGTANYAAKSGPSGAGVGLWGAAEGGGGVDGGIYKQQVGGCRPKTGHALQQQQSQTQPLAGLLPDAFMAGNGGKPLSAPTKNAKEEEGACALDAMPGERVEMARLGGSDLQGAGALGESMGGTKADSFLNGILRKAKSFARHSSATVSGPVDPADNPRDGAGLTTAVAAPLNPSLPGRRSLRPANASASSLKGGLKGGMGGNTVASAGAAGGQERASAGTSGPRIAASSSSSSKHMSGGFGQTGLAVPS